MATTNRPRPLRSLVTLAVLLLALVGAVLAGTRWSDATLLPKLALDLEGGTQIILEPTADSGEEVTEDTITQAIDIIRQRVDSSGVAEAEITSQGGRNIVVAIPGRPDEATLDLVRESAQMVFRPVLLQGAPAPVAEGEEDPAAEETDEETEEAEPTDPSDPAWLTQDVLDEYEAYDCTDPANLTGGADLVGDPELPVVACDAAGAAKYVLGPVELDGTDVAGANSGLRVTPAGIQTNEWATFIDFNGAGTSTFRDVTTRLQPLPPPRNQFAMVLDGLVISAPSVNQVISDGNAEISGSFTRETAGTLARQLNFGSLPLTFEVQSEQQISATLGSEQLQRGLLAGLIGLVLVGLYSLFQYRALGLVTISSLLVAGGLAYGLISMLSWTAGYRLSLPGVAGIIVAIGVTADSFIVYFERVRDELRDGRTLAAAIAQGWARARRTILVSDAVNLLAAVVLYALAVGGVRGFAFTLGLMTVIDLVVVFLFTHPVLELLSRTRFFRDGHPMSGLDPEQLGARSRYVGRGRVVPAGERADARTPSRPGATAVPAEVGAAGRRLTIAERRAAERRAAAAVQAPAQTQDVAQAEHEPAGADRKDV